MRKLGFVIALFAAFALAPTLSHAQSTDSFAKALHIYGSYRVVPNITYLTANNWEAKLDVYQARDATTPNPTLIYFHGGGWVQRSILADLSAVPQHGLECRKRRISAGEGLPRSRGGSGRTLRAAVGLPERQGVQCGLEPAGGHGELSRRTPCADDRHDSRERGP